MLRLTTSHTSGSSANARIAPATIRKMPLPIPMVTLLVCRTTGARAHHDHDRGVPCPPVENGFSPLRRDALTLRQPREHRVVLGELGVAVPVGRAVAAPRGA